MRKEHEMTTRKDWQKEVPIPASRQEELRTFIQNRGAGELAWLSRDTGDRVALSRADVEWLLLNELHLFLDLGGKRLSLAFADLTKVDLSCLPLEGIDMSAADLSYANLIDANLKEARLEWAKLEETRLQGADLSKAWMGGTDLRGARFNQQTRLNGTHFFTARPELSAEGEEPVRLRRTDPLRLQVAGVQWNDAQVIYVADLHKARRLGDDSGYRFRSRSSSTPLSDIKALRDLKMAPLALLKKKSNTRRGAVEYQECLQRVIGAYGQFAAMLDSQGLGHISRRMRYRSRQLERRLHPPFEQKESSRSLDARVSRISRRTAWISEGSQKTLRHLMCRIAFVFVDGLVNPFRLKLEQVSYAVRHYVKTFLSVILDLMCGYGYKPVRIIVAYLLTVGVFARIYATYPPSKDAPHGWNTIWLSMIAFHGRGIVNSTIGASSTLLWAPALEAAIGLVIEALLVAVIIRRLFRS
jgi:hypothetical protein